MKQLYLFICDCIAFILILSITKYILYPNLPDFLICLKLTIPFMLISTYFMWLFFLYDITLLRKKKYKYPVLFFVYFISIFASGMFYYLIKKQMLYLPTLISWPVIVLVLTAFFIFAFIIRAVFRTSLKSTFFILGKSDTIEELCMELRNFIGYNLIEIDDFLKTDRNYNEYPSPSVIISHKFVISQPETWKFIVNKFIFHGISLNTDFHVFKQIMHRASFENIKNEKWLLRSIGYRGQEYFYINFLKRFIDINLALLLLLLLFPLIIFICLVIKIIDREEIFFIQERAGFMNRTIKLYKFRSIKKKHQETAKEEYTHTGRLLRRFHIDEIPQLINIIKGDISFIGPRPLWVKDQQFWDREITNHSIRTIVKPGLTGWAQINYKAPKAYIKYNDSIKKEDIKKEALMRFSYDIWYIQNCSLLLDIDIFFKTVVRIFVKD